MARVNLVGDSYWLGLHTPPCTGSRQGRCATDFDTATDEQFPTGRMEYRLDTLPEGLTEVHASAHEISGGQYGNPAFGPTWTAKIDRSGPQIGLGGGAWDARVGSDGIEGESLMAGGVYELTADTTDGLSGVATVAVTVDGRPLPEGSSTFENTCVDDGCGLSAAVKLYGSDLTVGDHVVRVTARDRAGNTTERAFTVYSRFDVGQPFRGAQTGDADPGGYEDDGMPSESTDEVTYPCGGEGEEPCARDDSSNPTVLESLLEPGGTRLPPIPLVGVDPIPGSTNRAGSVNGVSGSNFWAFSDQAVDFRCDSGQARDLTGTSIGALAASGEPMTTTLDRKDWKALKVRQVRYILPYYVVLGSNPANPDAASTDPAVPNEFKCAWLRWRIWYASAKRNVGAGQILVSFGDPFKNRDGRDAPAAAFYEQNVRGFLDIHPDISRYTAWNEPDISNSLRGSTEQSRIDQKGRLVGAHQAAVYWRLLNNLCNENNSAGQPRACAVPAWDATDKKWPEQRGYFDVYARKLGGKPSVWAIHAYSSAFAGRAGRLLTFLRETSKIRRGSVVWVTEVGGVVRIAAGFLAQTPPDAEVSLGKLMSKLTTDTRFDRIRRFYYHARSGDELEVPPPGQVNTLPQPGVPSSAGGKLSKFDTGLISPYDRKKRQLYCLYQKQNNPAEAATCQGDSAY